MRTQILSARTATAMCRTTLLTIQTRVDTSGTVSKKAGTMLSQELIGLADKLVEALIGLVDKLVEESAGQTPNLTERRIGLVDRLIEVLTGSAPRLTVHRIGLADSGIRFKRPTIVPATMYKRNTSKRQHR